MKLDLDKIKTNKKIEELINFGIINIDKPTGPTSFSVSHLIMKKLGVNKTSHFGTLDPAVSGVLPVGLGRACRLNEYFMHRDKEYVGIMRLHGDVDGKKLNETIKEFIGKIKQLPPVRSNVKRAERVREVKSFDIIEIDGKDVLFRAIVEAGTYIRKLVHDMGEKLGGAHMLELRRTKAGMFDESTCVSLYDFDKAIDEYKKGNDKTLREMIAPGEIVSQILPSVQIKVEYIKKCLTGSPLFNEYAAEKVKFNKDLRICAFSGDRFVGCYRVVNERSFFAVPEFVFN